jgi:alkylation response protein AidB-like acyl-CoA dehydrogenase
MTLDRTLLDTAARVFAEISTPAAVSRMEARDWLGDEWRRIEELGFSRALIPEGSGGYGLDPVDALALVRIAGAFALPLPLAETLMASWLLACAGLTVPEGPLTVAGGAPHGIEARREGDLWRLRGHCERVPWGGQARFLAVVVPGEKQTAVFLLRGGQWQAEPGQNLAGEPRDRVGFDAAIGEDSAGLLPPHLGGAAPRLLGAAVRSIAMAGAMETVLSLSVRYANERVQFGKPIGKFQAIQHNLAILAGEAVAARGAADLAAEAAANGLDVLPVAAAKVRVGEAAGKAASIAHQVHGALGFTREHSLNLFTRRLWSWRNEFGNEAEWSAAAGRAAIGAGADGFWPLVSAV